MDNNKDFVFTKKNYQILLIGIALILLGFLLMRGGGSDDGVSYNPEIFSFSRITLAPILIVAGLIVDVYAIFYRDNK